MAENTRRDARQCTALARNVSHQLRTFDFDPQLIVNMYETKAHFDIVGTLTWADKGSRTMTVRGTGTTRRCTIVLAVSLGDIKLIL